MSMEDDYKYLQVKDAITCINQRVNLIGVILEFGVPKRSKGSDWFCTLKIIDESYKGPGIAVNFFAETVDKLPCVESAGDIVQLSRVVIKSHSREVYALFNKKFSSFALYEGKCSKNYMPYQVSSKFHSKDKDKKFITRLRDWMDDFQFDAGLNEFLSLREIKEGEFADLVCKILHTCEAAEGKWTIFIWDGTDAPPVGIQKRLEDEKQDPLPLGLNPSLLNRDTLCTFPPIGTILPVDIDQGNEKFGLHLLVTGRWVRFLNIKCEVHFGLWRGVLVPSSRLRFVPDEAQVVVHRRRLFGERLTNKWDRMPTASFPWPSQITVTDNGSAGFLTLMDILTCSQVTCKFKCIVRVVAACPWQAEDFLSPRGIYRIRLTLEDPTARIHAFVYAEDGKKFFGGYPTIDVMRRKINKLLGITKGEDGKEIVGAPRNPPWIQCCIKSYYQTKSDRWGSRKYRIFGTRLLDE